MRRIEVAFGWRVRPGSCVVSNAPRTDEYEDAGAFDDIEWKDVSDKMLNKHPAAIYGFSPEAFAYYLPGIMASAVRDNAPDSRAVDGVVAMLDRSNQAGTWDDWFVARWSLFSVDELVVVSDWLLWLASSGDAGFTDSQLTRALDTVDMLRARELATPIAGRGT